MKALFLFTAILLTQTSYSQHYETVIHNGDTIEVFNPVGNGEDTTIITNKDGTTSIFIQVEQMPQPDYDVYAYLRKNLRYPTDAKEKDISGRVAVMFLVRKTGDIDSAIVVKSISPSIDSEALRLINSMPAWKPGKNHGELADIWYTLLVIFRAE